MRKSSIGWKKMTMAEAFDNDLGYAKLEDFFSKNEVVDLFNTYILPYGEHHHIWNWLSYGIIRFIDGSRMLEIWENNYYSTFSDEAEIESQLSWLHEEQEKVDAYFFPLAWWEEEDVVAPVRESTRLRNRIQDKLRYAGVKGHDKRLRWSR